MLGKLFLYTQEAETNPFPHCPFPLQNEFKMGQRPKFKTGNLKLMKGKHFRMSIWARTCVLFCISPQKSRKQNKTETRPSSALPGAPAGTGSGVAGPPSSAPAALQPAPQGYPLHPPTVFLSLLPAPSICRCAVSLTTLSSAPGCSPVAIGLFHFKHLQDVATCCTCHFAG